MADVIFGEYSKKIIRLAAKLVRKKLKVDTVVVDSDLRSNQNHAVKAINTVLLAGANQLKPKYQRDTIKQLGQLGLWIVTKDTAYRDVFFWAIYQLLKRADKLLPLLEPYVKPAEEWQPNLWYDSKQITKEKRKKGELPDFGQSMEETVFTPSIQDKRHKEILGGNK